MVWNKCGSRPGSAVLIGVVPIGIESCLGESAGDGLEGDAGLAELLRLALSLAVGLLHLIRHRQHEHEQEGQHGARNEHLDEGERARVGAATPGQAYVPSRTPVTPRRFLETERVHIFGIKAEKSWELVLLLVIGVSLPVGLLATLTLILATLEFV